MLRLLFSFYLFSSKLFRRIRVYFRGLFSPDAGSLPQGPEKQTGVGGGVPGPGALPGGGCRHLQQSGGASSSGLGTLLGSRRGAEGSFEEKRQGMPSSFQASNHQIIFSQRLLLKVLHRTI